MQPKRSLGRCISATLRSATLATLAVGVAAPAAHAAQLEEVVVKATRRTDTDLQTTPVSVTPVTAEDFGKLFAQDIGEIAAFVPNFSAATIAGFNAASFAMRGAAETDIIVYFDPKVGVIVDDFVIPHVQTQLLEPFDIESVEVLRGPQGTLFGKNTTAGAVVVRTKRPEFDERYVEGAVRYGRFQDIKTNFGVNLPINDQLAFRFSGLYQNSDGYYESGKVDVPVNGFGGAQGFAARSLGQPFGGSGENLGGKDVFSGRAKLLWEPNERLSVLAQYEIIRDSSEPVPAVNITPEGLGPLEAAAPFLGFQGVTSGDPLEQAGNHSSPLVNLDDDQDIDVNGGYLNIDYELDNHTISGVFGYRDQTSRIPNEYLGTSFPSFFAASRDDNRETMQVEARIASDLPGPVNYVIGGFYQRNDAEFCVLQQLGFFEFFGLANSDVSDSFYYELLCNAQDASARAAFADLTVDVTDRLQIGMGVRYTYEKKEFIGRARRPVTEIFPEIAPNIPIQPIYDLGLEPLDGQDFSRAPGTVQTDSETWAEPTWRFTLSYEFTDDLYAYFTSSRGFKSGGYNDQIGSSGAFPADAYDPEFANNIEFGIKSSFFDQRVRFNATYFNVRYEDFQRSFVVSDPRGTGAQETRTFNASEVISQGFEFELEWLIVEDLMLRANLGWLDAEYEEFLVDINGDGTPEDFTNREVSRAPEWTAGIDLTYNQTLASLGSLRYNFNFSYEDENIYYHSPNAANPEQDTVLDARTIVNLSATWRDPSERYHVSVFGKNLTDDRYLTASQFVGGLWVQGNFGPPRVWGVEAGGRFDF